MSHVHTFLDALKPVCHTFIPFSTLLSLYVTCRVSRFLAGKGIYKFRGHRSVVRNMLTWYFHGSITGHLLYKLCEMVLAREVLNVLKYFPFAYTTSFFQKQHLCCPEKGRYFRLNLLVSMSLKASKISPSPQLPTSLDS